MDLHKSTSGDIDESGLRPDEADIPMPRGSRYAGQAVDIASRRSIEIQPGGDRSELIDAKDSHSVVDFFFHEGQFWRAIIPLNGVDQVFGQAFNFSKPRTRRGDNGREILFDKHGLPRRTIPILNHVQSRFTLRPDQPVELYPLGSDEFGSPVHRVHDIIYSFEAVGPVGISFNIRDGLTGNLMSAHRFVSIQEMVFERLVVENQYVTESPPLPLENREKRALLTESLLRSHRAGTTERYYLFRIFGTNNCTSSPFQIVDNVVKYQWTQRLGSALYRLPLSPRFYLRVRGLDSDPSFRKMVRSEFEAYIGNARTQQRKRDHVRRQIRIRRNASRSG
jgi:hypothetical protein